MDLKKIEQLMKLAKKHGVSHISIGIDQYSSVDFTLSPDHLASPPPPKTSSVDTKPPETDGPSEEELLFWSSGGVLPSQD